MAIPLSIARPSIARPTGFARAPRLALLGAALFLAAASFGVASPRQALWQVVRACVADFGLTGRPFPCLAVDLSGGEERGYVVLRPPFGSPDTVLVPTRKVVGVEDPWLQSPEAPNYFAAAWEWARRFQRTPDGSLPAPEEIALAVNPRSARTQDQLHIHIGCQTPLLRQLLRRLAAAPDSKGWTRLGEVALGAPIWGLRVPASDLASVEPFRVAAAGPAANAKDRSELIVVAASIRVEGRDEFALVSATLDRLDPGRPFAAERLVDSACGRRSLDFQTN